MGKMLYHRQYECPWGCCGDFVKGRGTKHACKKWHRILRTREKRNWKKEEWA